MKTYQIQLIGLRDADMPPQYQHNSFVAVNGDELLALASEFDVALIDNELLVIKPRYERPDPEPPRIYV